jgi:ATP-dependent Clp protease ATP-binding subunit ClpA
MNILLSDKMKQAIGIAQSIAREFMNVEFTPAHLLKAILHKDVGLIPLLEEMGIDFYYMEEWAEVRIEAAKIKLSIRQPDADNSVKLSLIEAIIFRF